MGESGWVRRFEDAIRAGGVVVFPADTVYGLACDPANEAAITELYALKGRAPTKPAAHMVFSPGALPPIPGRGIELLPGPVTLLIPGPGGGTLGIRYPANTLLEGARVTVLQSSANLAGGPDARTLDEVPLSIREGADLVIDAGPLPGAPSTVVDLTGDGHRIVREGALSAAEIARRLAT